MKNESLESEQGAARQSPQLLQDIQNPKLGELLVEQGKITAKDLAVALSQQLGVPYVDLDNYQIQPEALKLIPESVAREHSVLPLSITDGSLRVVMVNPNDINILELLNHQAKMRIVPMIATAEDIQEAIDRGIIGVEIEPQSYLTLMPTFLTLNTISAIKTVKLMLEGFSLRVITTINFKHTFLDSLK